MMASIIIIALLLTALYAGAFGILFWLTRRSRPQNETSQAPDPVILESCEDVDPDKIDPPHNVTLTCAELKAQYLEAERQMVATHDPAMAPKIRRALAGCLIQGWPLDVAICQAAYSFFYGTCRCPTCRSLIESHS